MNPELTVVIPFHNEAESVHPLLEDLYTALADHSPFELVCVDDGSADDTFERLRAVQRARTNVRLVRHRNQCGQSTAVRTGVKRASAPWVVTLDGDGQNDPADIPKLLAVVQGPTYTPDLQLVIGVRQRRQDNLIKRISSRVANAVRAGILGDDAPDSGCGLKLFRRDAFLDLPYFDHMHRFLPALVQRNGGRVVSVPVNHRPRERGRSHYGVIDRLGAGIVDLLGTFWLQRRARRPIIQDWEGPTDSRSVSATNTETATPVTPNQEGYPAGQTGNREAIIVPLAEWRKIREDLEELDNIRACDKAKRHPSEP